MTTGNRARTLHLKQISAQFVDKLYDKLLDGPKGKRVRLANGCMTLAKRAWDVVHRLYPKTVPSVNPFAGVVREHSTTETQHAPREETYALAKALADLGHPNLALAPLVCFEWHQRPEHVLSGVLTWTDYRPTQRPNAVRIVHPKTGAMVWMPLEDDEGLLFPEIESVIAALPRRGVQMVVTAGLKGSPRTYSHFYARSLVHGWQPASEST